MVTVLHGNGARLAETCQPHRPGRPKMGRQKKKKCAKNPGKVSHDPTGIPPAPDGSARRNNHSLELLHDLRCGVSRDRQECPC